MFVVKSTYVHTDSPSLPGYDRRALVKAASTLGFFTFSLQSSHCLEVSNELSSFRIPYEASV